MKDYKHAAAAVALLALVLVAVVLGTAGEGAGGQTPTTEGPTHNQTAAVMSTDTQPEPEPVTCPITAEEITMLAQTIGKEAQVVYWNGTKYGVTYQARQAAVAWVALNRYDAAGGTKTLADILTAPYQFVWEENAPVTDQMMALAQDVVARWRQEQQGESDVGRTIPADYLYFDGDGRENYFRKNYKDTGEYWDWSLPDPYQS